MGFSPNFLYILYKIHKYLSQYSLVYKIDINQSVPLERFHIITSFSLSVNIQELDFLYYFWECLKIFLEFCIFFSKTRIFYIIWNSDGKDHLNSSFSSFLRGFATTYTLYNTWLFLNMYIRFMFLVSHT